MADQTVLVDVGYACYGLVARDGVIVEAPPIARWTIGRRLDEVVVWVARKRGRVTITAAPD